jgi:chemotaxis protein methyltransferase WspC
MESIEFENLLKYKMGLDAASIGSAAVERAVKSRMTSLGFKQATDYWDHLRASADELQKLIEGVVVPETWFFRDPQAFVALVRLVTEERRHVLRLLSVPCSTGEEPYSLVMSLLDGGFLPEQLHVDAVDISARALAVAQRGVYGSNSFRGAGLTFRDRYFQPTANGYALAERLRSHVTFHQRNILAPDFSFRPESYDVIFCRNLLIYFDRPTQEQVIKTLTGLLTPTGFLFVGPAEAFLASANGFTSVNQAMSFAFRRGTGAKTAGPSVPLPRSGIVSKPTILRPPRTGVPDFAPTPIPPSLSLRGAGLGTAQRLADSGRLQEAATWCDADLVERGPSCETYYLLGLVCDATGDRERAGACYQKAIYLQPEHVEALTHLALMKEGQGDFGAAGRLHERARRVESSGRRVS